MQVELPDELVAEATTVAERSGRSAEALIAETLSESLKMRRIPGIVFADGATGRRARIAGTGVEVFEVIDAYELFGRDVQRLSRDLPELRPEQIEAAIAFYEAYPEDIAPRLRPDEEVEVELRSLWSRYPMTRPGAERQSRSEGLSDDSSVIPHHR